MTFHMKKKAVNKPVKKRVNKPLTSQKIGSLRKLQSKTRRHPEFRPFIQRVLQRPGTGRLGQRKIRRIQVHTGGGPLYNTYWRDAKRTDRPWVRRVRPSGPPGYRKVQAFRNDKTPLLILLQNKLMHDGRKGPAEKVFWKTVQELNRFSPERSGYALFYMALDRLKPALATVVRRVGRNYYQVPVPIQSRRQYKMAFQ
jgi:hypothetical protein